MCGIAGYYSRAPLDKQSRESLLYDFHKSILHRGPDHYGPLSKEHWGILNNRLSIVDLSNGNQPFSNHDDTIHVVQNGEIYNFIELKTELKSKGVSFHTDSDTEIILKGYENEGIDFIQKMNGMFAISIVDENINKSFLIRDRLGVKPLYYANINDQVYFSSEIKTFFSHDIKISKKINYQSLHNFLVLNYIPQPATIFEGIQHVSPGTYLEVDLKTQKTQSHRYWDLKSFYAPKAQDENKIVDNIHDILLSATEIRLRSDVPMSAFLSGGIDSSLVCQYAYGLLNHDCRQVFSIGFEDKRFDESYYFNYVAKKLNLNPTVHFLEDDIIKHWKQVTWNNDQPHGDISFIPTYILAQRAAKEYKVVLTGDGGDEAWGGYLKYMITGKECNIDQYIESISLFSESDGPSKLYSQNFLSQIDTNFIDKLFKETTEHIDENDLVNKALHFDTEQLLPGNNLVKPDRMGMASSLEARSPLLDYRMFEFSQSIHGNDKVQQNESKYYLKKLNERFFSHEHTYRTKQMFTVPVGEWFKGKLKNYLIDVLTSESFKSRNLFKQDYVEQMIEQHVSQAKNYTRELRALVALEHWFQVFID